MDELFVIVPATSLVEASNLFQEALDVIINSPHLSESREVSEFAFRASECMGRLLEQTNKAQQQALEAARTVNLLVQQNDELAAHLYKQGLLINYEPGNA